MSMRLGLDFFSGTTAGAHPAQEDGVLGLVDARGLELACNKIIQQLVIFPFPRQARTPGSSR
jgi:hypothetical protein